MGDVAALMELIKLPVEVRRAGIFFRSALVFLRSPRPTIEGEGIRFRVFLPRSEPSSSTNVDDRRLVIRFLLLQTGVSNIQVEMIAESAHLGRLNAEL